MNAPVLVFLFLLFIIIGATIIFLGLARRSRRKFRKATIESLKIDSEYSIIKKSYNLSKSLLSAHPHIKSPVLAAAEQFKRHFRLGRFVIFCSDKSLLQPLMGVGLKLKSIKPISIELATDCLANLEGAARLTKSRSGIPLPETCLPTFQKAANLPEDMASPLVFYHNHHRQSLLFIGEDPDRELGRYCASDAFNGAIWPLLYDICRRNNDIKRYRNKLRSLQSDHSQAKSELGNLNRRLRHKIIDLHSFFEISNNMFTIYDQRRLVESLIESLNTILRPSKIVVMTRIKEGGNFKPLANNGQIGEDLQALQLSTESKVFSLLASQNRALALPMLSSGLPDSDPFLEKALALGLSQMEKLHTGGEIFGIVLMGEKPNEKSFDPGDIEIFSTLSNLASLALGNIHQYMLIEKMSYTDFVTELYNYRYFYKRLKEEIFRAKRFDRMLALVIFDIDNFKLFNDTYGHQAGDEVLKNLSRLVTRSVRAIDVVSRYGGEEFCIIMPDTGYANCLIFIERLRKKIEFHKFSSKFVKEGYKITVSVGGAIYPIDSQTADRLIYCADMGLLKAKAEGRNRSMMFNNQMLEDEALKNTSRQQLSDMGIHEDF